MKRNWDGSLGKLMNDQQGTNTQQAVSRVSAKVSQCLPVTRLMCAPCLDIFSISWVGYRKAKSSFIPINKITTSQEFVCECVRLNRSLDGWGNCECVRD